MQKPAQVKKYVNYEDESPLLENLSNYIFSADYEYFHEKKNKVMKPKYFFSTTDRVGFFKANSHLEPSLYEVINGACIFICDIDKCPKFTEEDIQSFEDNFLDHYNNKFHEVYDRMEFIWMHANKENEVPELQGSYHIMIHVINGEDRRGFGSLPEQKYFWGDFPQSFRYAKNIDMNIYTRNRSWRLFGSSKIGQKRPLIAMHRERLKSFEQFFAQHNNIMYLDVPYVEKPLITTNSDFDGAYPESLNEVVDILSKCPWKSFGYNHWFAMVCKIKYILGSAGKEICKNFFIKKGWNRDFDVYETDELFETANVKQECTLEEFYNFCGVLREFEAFTPSIEYEAFTPSNEYKVDVPKEEITQSLSKQDLEITEWLNSTTVKIEKASFAESIAEIISSLCGLRMKTIAKGFFDRFCPDNVKINSLYEKPTFKKYHIIDLIRKLKINTVRWNEEYCQPRVKDFNFSDKHLFIRSGTGTGKTYKIITQFKNKSILFVCYRRMLTRDLCSYKIEFPELDIGHYEEDDIKSGARVPKILLCQLESLWKFSAHINKYDLIVFDESENIISQLDNIKVGSRLEKTRLVLNYIFREKAIIAMSANLGQRTFNFVQRYSNREIFSVINTYKDKQGYSAVLYYGWHEKIYKLLNENKRLAIAMNSKNQAEKLFAAVKEKYPAMKALLMTADTLKNNEEVMLDVNKSWSQYDVVIYSACVEAGVSFDVRDHFDHICAKFTRGANNHLSQFQSLFRVRHPKNKEIILNIDNDIKEGKYYPMDKVNLIHTYRLKEYSKNLAIEDRMTFKATKLGILEVNFEEPLNLQFLENISFDRYSQAFMKSLLLHELCEAGCEIKQGEEQTEVKNIIKHRKVVGEKIVYVKTPEEKILAKEANQLHATMDINLTFESNEDKHKIRRQVYVNAGLCQAKVVVKSGETEFQLDKDKNVEKLSELQKTHRTLNAATKHIQNFTRVDKFHRYLQKKELIKNASSEIRENYERKFSEIGGHISNSATLAIVKIHEFISFCGYYEKHVYAKNVLLQKITNYLFGTDKNYDLFNKTFKANGRGWIYPKDKDAEKFEEKLCRYVRDILVVYNFRIDKKRNVTQDSQIVAITETKLKSIETFKMKLN